MLALSIGSSCTPTFPVVLQPPETLANTSSALLVLIPAAASDGVRVVAVDSIGAGALSLESEGVRVYWLEYGCSLDRLGFTGEVMRAHPKERGRHLPEPSRIFRMEMPHTGGDAWEEIRDPPPELTELRLPVGSDCAEFRRVDRIITASWVDYSVDLGDGTAALSPRHPWVGADTFTFIRVGRDGITEFPEQPRVLDDYGAYRAPGGDVWLFGRGGAMAAGRFEDGFASVPGLPVRDDSFVVAAGSRRGGIEFVLGSSRGYLGVHDGRSVLTLIEEATPEPPFGAIYDVEWLGPGRAVATLPFQDGLVVVDDGQIVESDWPPSERRPDLVTWSSGLGILAAFGPGRVLNRSDEGWVELGVIETGIGALEGFRRGAVAATEGGALVEVLRDGTICPRTEPLDDGIRVLGRVGGDLLSHWRFQGDSVPMVSYYEAIGSCPGLGVISDYAPSVIAD
ncbi:hypothetical protein L6R52_10330 [Myxococcota bacterium]|nr:hypothetical protein [Myxococcota bacterium]